MLLEKIAGTNVYNVNNSNLASFRYNIKVSKIFGIPIFFLHAVKHQDPESLIEFYFLSKDR